MTYTKVKTMIAGAIITLLCPTLGYSSQVMDPEMNLTAQDIIKLAMIRHIPCSDSRYYLTHFDTTAHLNIQAVATAICHTELDRDTLFFPVPKSSEVESTFPDVVIYEIHAQKIRDYSQIKHIWVRVGQYSSQTFVDYIKETHPNLNLPLSFESYVDGETSLK